MLKILLGAALSCGLALNASALVLEDGTDVGGIDTFLAETGRGVGEGKLANSNPTTELNWVNQTLASNKPFFLDKTEDVKYYQTDAAGVFAFELSSDPGYYVIKNSNYWALFANVDNLGWAVFDTAGMNSGFNLPDMKSLTISHVTEFASEVTPVPLPATLPLVLAALAGLGIARRKARKG